MQKIDKTKIPIILFILLILFSQLFSCRKSYKFANEDQAIIAILNNFLQFSTDSFLKRSSIENLLYDIQGPRSTLGRAFWIGDNIFLTANHVIDKKNQLQLVHQSKRGLLKPEKGKFVILSKNKEYDLALLKSLDKTPKKRLTGRANLHLFSKSLEAGINVSQFLYYVGPKPGKKEEFILEYDGLDYYDNVKLVQNLGKFVFLKKSHLFEKQGFIYNFNFSFFQKIGLDKGIAKVNPEVQYFTSIPVFPGESGSGVYYRKKVGNTIQYALAGITVIAWAINYSIDTPNHPLGYKTLQQSSNFIVKGSIIRKFIEEYLRSFNT